MTDGGDSTEVLRVLCGVLELVYILLLTTRECLFSPLQVALPIHQEFTAFLFDGFAVSNVTISLPLQALGSALIVSLELSDHNVHYVVPHILFFDPPH